MTRMSFFSWLRPKASSVMEPRLNTYIKHTDPTLLTLTVRIRRREIHVSVKNIVSWQKPISTHTHADREHSLTTETDSRGAGGSRHFDACGSLTGASSCPLLPESCKSSHSQKTQDSNVNLCKYACAEVYRITYVNT